MAVIKNAKSIYLDGKKFRCSPEVSVVTTEPDANGDTGHGEPIMSGDGLAGWSQIADAGKISGTLLLDEGQSPSDVVGRPGRVQVRFHSGAVVSGTGMRLMVTKEAAGGAEISVDYQGDNVVWQRGGGA